MYPESKFLKIQENLSWKFILKILKIYPENSEHLPCIMETYRVSVYHALEFDTGIHKRRVRTGRWLKKSITANFRHCLSNVNKTCYFLSSLFGKAPARNVTESNLPPEKSNMKRVRRSNLNYLIAKKGKKFNLKNESERVWTSRK